MAMAKFMIQLRCDEKLLKKNAIYLNGDQRCFISLVYSGDFPNNSNESLPLEDFEEGRIRKPVSQNNPFFGVMATPLMKH